MVPREKGGGSAGRHSWPEDTGAVGRLISNVNACVRGRGMGVLVAALSTWGDGSVFCSLRKWLSEISI